MTSKLEEIRNEIEVLEEKLKNAKKEESEEQRRINLELFPKLKAALPAVVNFGWYAEIVTGVEYDEKSGGFNYTAYKRSYVNYVSEVVDFKSLNDSPQLSLYFILYSILRNKANKYYELSKKVEQSLYVPKTVSPEIFLAEIIQFEDLENFKEIKEYALSVDDTTWEAYTFIRVLAGGNLEVYKEVIKEALVWAKKEVPYAFGG